MRAAAVIGVMAAALTSATAPAQVTPRDGATSAPVSPEGPQPAGQPDRPTGRRGYDAAYFAQYSPQSALQIAERVPGFSIEQVDPSVRGFGQAAGNVVIDGQRPSSKTDTIQTILARIPASRVARVEVGPGDAFGAEYTGKAQVLNLILTRAGGSSVTVEGTARRAFTGKLYPEGSVSALVKRGPSTFNASLTLDNELTSEKGYDTLVTLPDEQLIEYRRKLNRIADPNLAAAASWEYNGGTHRTAHLNVRAVIDRLSLTQRNDVFPASGPERDDGLTQRYDTRSVELGGDVTRPFAGGGLKLIGLATRRYRDFADALFMRVQSQLIGGSRQRLNDTLAETLGRIVWNRADWGGWNVELGGEVARNRLRSRVDLFALNAGGGATRIDLPVDDAVVGEWRGEAFANAGRPLSSKLRLDLGLNYERSRLTVRGDAQAERTLSFLKPKAVLDWRPAGKWHAQLTVQRTVAQLDFEDFISSAELNSEQVNGGNPDLVPQRSWETLATLEHPILGDGLWRLELGYNRVSLVQDRVPRPGGFDAPGNLGTGEVYILRNRVEAPLKTLGIPGGRLILYGSLVSSRVRDPYTLDYRPFSGNALFLGEATFRQDRPRYAWGVTLSGNTPSTVYRRDELDRRARGWPYATAFVEWRPAAQTTLTFSLENALATSASRRRLFFDPDRSSPDPVAREFRHRNQYVIPVLTFRKTFG